MKKQTVILTLIAALSSLPASASAAKYLYFVAQVDTKPVVYNLNMDPLYPSILGQTAQLACEYKTPAGDVQSLEFEYSPCGGGPTFGLSLSIKNGAGKVVHSTSTYTYSEHRTIDLEADLSTGEEGRGISFMVMSATQYQDLVNNVMVGSMFPTIDRVPSVMRDDSLQSDRLPAGFMNCRIEHLQELCENGH